MKILHASDFHGNKKYFDWIKSVQYDYSAICLSGDFIDGSCQQTESLEAQIEWIRRWVDSMVTPLFLCSGNHDGLLTDPNLDDLESLFSINEDEWYEPDVPTFPSHSNEWLMTLGSRDQVFTDTRIVKVNGVMFGCIPYEAEDFERYSACDVVLYHQPPTGLDVANNIEGDFGCSRVRRALDAGTLNPRWLLSGHVHKPLSNLSKIGHVAVSNPGQKKRASIPAFSVINL